MDFLEYIKKNKSFVVFVILLIAFIVVFTYAFINDKKLAEEQKEVIVNKTVEESKVKLDWNKKTFSQSVDLENVSFTVEELDLSEGIQSITFQLKNNDNLAVSNDSFNYFIYDGNKKIIMKNTATVSEDVLKNLSEKVYGSDLRWNKFDYVSNEKVDLEEIEDSKNANNKNTKVEEKEEKIAEKNLIYKTGSDYAQYKYVTKFDENYQVEKSDLHVVVYNLKFTTEKENTSESKNGNEEPVKINVTTSNKVFDFKIDEKDVTVND